MYTRTYLGTAQCDNNRNCVYLRYECYILSMLPMLGVSMLNDDNNNNPSVVRPQSYISYALVGKFFSLSDTYLPPSIYLYLHKVSLQQPKKWGSDSKYPKRAIQSDKMSWRAGTREKKASKWISLSLSSPIVEMKPRDFLLYIHYLGK